MERGVTLQRPPASPLRTNSRLRLCAFVSPDDVNSQRISVPYTNQIQIAGSSKSHSKNAFENVFGPENAQETVATSLLPELLHSLFNGNDCAFVAFGGKSRGKEGLLYGGDEATKSGLLQTCVESMFKMMEESRSKRPDLRLQLRLSALMYSQRENNLIDLLSAFNSDPRRKSVKITEDVENESAIKVESPEQALFYLNAAVDHRIIEDEEIFRTSHLFLFFSLYTYRTGGLELEGGRRRLAFVDMGIGERNSQRGELTMPVLGGLLLTLFQGQKHIPSRENTLSQLLRCALSSSRLSTILCSFATKTDDNENVVQLASKLSRVKRNRSSHTKSSETGSSRGGGRSELESGSEMSAAETVIYVGPRPLHRSPALPPRSPSVCSKVTQTSDSSGKTCTGSVPPVLKGHTPFLSATLKLYDDLCSPPGTSYDVAAVFGGKSNDVREDYGITIAPPKRSPSRNVIGTEKRDGIMQWLENCEPLVFDEERVESGKEIRECVILSHPLEDIIEIDEESMRESLLSRRNSHPLRILSKEAINKVDSVTDKGATHDSDEDALERAMEASVSSMRSHDILAKLQSPDLSSPKEATISMTTGTPSEMDLYRRASQLEEYANERMKELDDEKLKKKKSRLNLNCCQNSMLSSASTVDWNTVEKRKQIEREKLEDTRRREELKARRDQLKLEEGELRRERQQIDRELHDRPSLPAALVRQISNQLHSFNIGSKPSVRTRAPSDSLPTTPTISHKKIVPCRTPSLTNCSAQVFPSPFLPQNSNSTSKLPRREQPRKSSKTRSEKKERKNSEPRVVDQPVLRSPYTKVTMPKVANGPASSGRGSDDAASDHVKGRKRQSYSASSGYESGAGDYYSIYKDTRLERLRHVDKRLQLGREADNLRDAQQKLKKDLESAKARIGQVEDGRALCHEKSLSGLSQATLVDALAQENRILEKRLVACQNHTMLVTSFL